MRRRLLTIRGEEAVARLPRKGVGEGCGRRKSVEREEPRSTVVKEKQEEEEEEDPPIASAAEQQSVCISNSTMCSGTIDGDGGCLMMARAMPELEGFEMTVDLSFRVILRRSSQEKYLQVTTNTLFNHKSSCGRDKGPWYDSCTTVANIKACSPQKCIATAS
ncbi:hypothetical protein CDL15_Pgr020478 [Punica granatum]|uniref:Uncharacterized protein n=1 Tax=Punica granatum TaxID=22663 RepID=A0A218VWZ6_PUNGR|nr:hypothetical protein CDL15_Pgr020478 [Punica granatum]PKI43207.1 hypothetical protein CRG98_036404 [Punica granatum]